MYLTSRSIEQSQPKRDLKETKQKIIAQNLEAFTMQAKYDTIQYTHQLTHKTWKRFIIH